MRATRCLIVLAALSAYLAAAPVADAAAPACFGKKVTIVGTRSWDSLKGTPGDDVIAGLGGGDTIRGLGGDDLICGGQGPDELYGGAGNDQIDGEGGDDWLIGGADDDVLAGGDGADEAWFDSAAAPVVADLAAGTATGEGSDTLSGIEDVSGSDFDDTLTGDATGNLLIGGAGNDVIDGSGGDDALVGGDGDDTLGGGDGEDSVLYILASDQVRADLTAGTATGEGSDTLSGIEDLFGSDYDDTLIGDAGPNVFYGGFAGDDTISGAGGDDALIGDFAFCFFLCLGEPGDDVLAGGDGFDSVTYVLAGWPIQASLAAGTVTGEGSDRLTGIEALEGSDYDDTITGDAGRNILVGADGYDRLDGGAETDTCVQGEDNVNCEVSVPFGSVMGDRTVVARLAPRMRGALIELVLRRT